MIRVAVHTAIRSAAQAAAAALLLVAAPALSTAWSAGAGTAHAQEPAALPDSVRAAADRITAEQLWRDLEYLASDALLGRDTHSPGFDSAAVYIARRLERAGLRPAGDDGTYFQHYDLRELRVDTSAAYVEVAGRRFAFGDGFVVSSFAGALSGTFEVVYVGHGWTVPDHDIDPWAGVDVRGRIVLAHGPPSAPRGVELQRIGRLTMNAVAPWEEAQRRGAAGILYIPPTNTLPAVQRARRANLVRRELEPGVPSAYAANPMTSLLLMPQVTEALLDGERVAGERVTGPELVARGDTADYAPSFRLARSITLNVPASMDVIHRPYNVVAMLQGSDPVLRNEYITLMSHLDGAVGTSTVNGDSIYNSADDNATGSAANLAVAEQMVRQRPKRSLIFVWDSGEERGLWGTRHFVHQPPVPLENVVAHINIDMIGATRAPGLGDSASVDVTGPNEVYLIGPGVLSGQVDELLQRVNREYLGMTFNRSFDTAASEFFYPRTDAGPFLERGILTIGFFTGVHDRYHQPADEVSYLDPAKLEAVARTVFVSAWTLASMPERPRIDQSIPATVPRYR